MPEAIAKYALNSTIGTPDFKPLDQIIKGQKSLVASDNIYATLLGRTVLTSGSSTAVDFKANCSGSAKLRLSNFNSYADASISVRGLATGNVTFTISKTSNAAEDRETGAFSFNKNETIRIVVNVNNTTNFDNLYLLANLIDGSALTIL